MHRSTHRIISAALAASALLAIPAAGQAKTFTFGHRVDHEPSNGAPGHNCNEDGNNEIITPSCTRVAIDGNQGGAVAAGIAAPANGVITKFRIRAGDAHRVRFVVVRLRELRRDPATNDMTAQGKVVARGPLVAVQGRGFDENEANAVESFKANVKVRKGDLVGLQSPKTSALYCSHGGDSHLIFSPRLGNVFQQSTKSDGCELLVQAVMKTVKPKKK
jgi:hypothetical protein